MFLSFRAQHGAVDGLPLVGGQLRLLHEVLRRPVGRPEGASRRAKNGVLSAFRRGEFRLPATTYGSGFLGANISENLRRAGDAQRYHSPRASICEFPTELLYR